MDTRPVNWEAMDSLVMEFVKSENLLEDTSTPSSLSSPSSSYESRRLVRQVRWSLESGDIDSAIDLLLLHVPFVLNDHRLLFCLQKQKFIELLRRGTAEGRKAAIDCLRTALAPCALDAYPEAYEEFKHILLALIYDKNDLNSPVAYEWSVRRRFEIAGFMSSTLRAHLHAHDPLLLMALRYLISIHKGYCFRQGVSSPISDLTQRLLLEEKDSPATPEVSLYEAPPFDEVDVQALAHAVELTRQGAVDSLKFSNGDLFKAFKNEVCRTRMNLSVVDELVHEYCVYRGIVNPVTLDLAGYGELAHSGHLKHNQLESSKHSDGESSITNTDCSEDVTSMHEADQDLHLSNDITSNSQDCSTSCYNRPKSVSILQRLTSHGDEGRRGRKRWRGRDDKDSLYDDFISKEDTKLIREEEIYEILLGIKDLASNGLAAEVVEEVNAIDPGFFGQNPLFMFQLKQVEFLKLVASGDISNALKLASSYLGPLAATDPSLLKPLKETLLAFLKPTEAAKGKILPLEAFASSLQVAIGRRLGIEEPRLMKVMRAALQTYDEWFKLQMCKDRFESLLKIDLLKEVDSSFLSDLICSSDSEACGFVSSQVTIPSSSRVAEDGSSPSQTTSVDICDESAILKVMEFLALPRADAIHLLAQYDGSAETVIQQLFP
ncbi:hypothetical protein V2J09_002254 [Rumex salicifolius]